MAPVNKAYRKEISNLREKLLNDPVARAEFMRSVLGPPHRSLDEPEKSEMMTLLTMLKPFKVTNNQLTWSEYYNHSAKVYVVTTINTDNYEIDEYDENDYR